MTATNELPRWALDVAEEIVGKTIFGGMVLPGTDLVEYWAEAIMEAHNSANCQLPTAYEL
jgi:hypothetical protein